MSYKKTIAIIILNYKGCDNTLACLNSLSQLQDNQFEIHLVDNDSGDGVLEKALEKFPQLKINTYSAPFNMGYSAGNNLAISKIINTNPQIDYFWILNNDTEVLPDTLFKLRQAIERYPNSLLGCKLIYPDGRFQRVGSYLNALKTRLKDYKEFGLSQNKKLASLTGASWLIPKIVFKTIGLLPENYFLYFEDNHFCFKAWQAGFECRLVSDALVKHQESASTKKQPALLSYYYQRNRLHFLKQFTHPFTFKFFALPYTSYRLLRCKLREGATSVHYQAFKFAVADFKQGVMGPCPHLL